MKRYILILGGLLFVSSVSFAQVKKKFQDKKHKNQTVVIKYDSEVSDIEILDSEFNIEDVRVGEEIKITTETRPQENSKVASSKKATRIKKVKRIKKQKTVSSSALNFKKKKSKRKKKGYVYYPSNKKSSGKDYSKKCYRW